MASAMARAVDSRCSRAPGSDAPDRQWVSRVRWRLTLRGLRPEQYSGPPLPQFARHAELIVHQRGGRRELVQSRIEVRDALERWLSAWQGIERVI